MGQIAQMVRNHMYRQAERSHYSFCLKILPNDSIFFQTRENHHPAKLLWRKALQIPLIKTANEQEGTTCEAGTRTKCVYFASVQFDRVGCTGKNKSRP